MRRLSTVLCLALLTVGAADPRPELVELQLVGRYEEALTGVRQALAEDSSRAQEWGLEYLEGHLLEHLQRDEESLASFSNAMTSAPILASHGQFRLAVNRYRSGRPEVAAGLLATLLASEPPQYLTPAALRWLRVALLESGDCHALSGWREWSLSSTQIRELQTAIVDCTLAAGDTQQAVDLMRSLLAENHSDETALRAALGLATSSPGAYDPKTTLLIGLALFQHREFHRAVPFLVAGLEDSATVSRAPHDIDRADLLYFLARCHYWQGQYGSAVQAFTQAAVEETEADKVARSLFQRSRSHALLGDWDSAVESFREAAEAAPTDSWAGAALISAMRLEWRQGREESALELFGQLRSRRSWRSSLERAAMFLAVSDLVRNRADRAAPWLDIARQARREDGIELSYWRGRLAELQGNPAEAVRHYLELLISDTLHPLALMTRRRLERGDLREVARIRGEKLASSDRAGDLVQAWLLLDGDHPASQKVRTQLEAAWLRSSRNRPFLEMQPSDPDQWSIWRHPMRRPEEILLALGIAETMSPTVHRVFPLDDPGLALAGSQLLSSSGQHPRSLYFAEVVSQRLPKGVPHQFLPGSFRQLLYPRPYGFEIHQQASRFGVDPDLLTAIIREESRFDSLAVSGASARGLTQFVWSTARRLGLKLKGMEIDPADLHKPEIAITLGAAYLAELADRFDGRTPQVVAAYNAGEDLARLWQAYCFSQEPEEYLSKVGFPQTRAYLEKVLKSRAYYAEIDSEESRP